MGRVRAFTPGVLAQAMGALPAARRVRIAYSGGPDSHVLLHACAALRPLRDGAVLDAVHVDHGLHPDSGAWARHCARTCADLGIELAVVSVDASPRAGESPEETARRARYRALAATAEPDSITCTAHHADDRAETVLLRLLRGAGPDGLAGMPRLRTLGPGWLARPLLGVARSSLARYAVEHGLRAIEDPANADPALDRSYLRHEVGPRLARRWPAWARVLGRAADHQAAMSALAAEVGAADAAAAAGERPGALSCSLLLALTPARRDNALRSWIAARGLPLPASAGLRRVVDEVLGAAPDRSPCVRWGGAVVRRSGDELVAGAPGPEPPALGTTYPWSPGDGTFRLPHGRLRVRATRGRGLRVARCARARVDVRFRRGGERCRPSGSRHRRSLKKLLQEAGVPAWERAGLPLVHVDGELAAVAGLWVCEGFQARPGEEGWDLLWHPAGSEQ